MWKTNMDKIKKILNKPNKMTTLITIACMAILTSIFCNYVEANNKASKKTKKENTITYL
jgi:hypothetical protein